MGVVGDSVKARLVFTRPVNADAHRLGHAVEGGDQLADFIAAFVHQLDVEVALRHLGAGAGEQGETPNHPAGRQGEQQARQQQGDRGDDQALLDIAGARILQEFSRQDQRDVAVALARQLNQPHAPKILGVIVRADLMHDAVAAITYFDHFQPVAIEQGFDDVAGTGVVLLRERSLECNAQYRGHFGDALFPSCCSSRLVDCMPLPIRNASITASTASAEKVSL